ASAVSRLTWGARCARARAAPARNGKSRRDWRGGFFRIRISRPRVRRRSLLGRLAREREIGSGGAEVACARLARPLVCDDVEVHLLTLVQIIHPSALDGADVDEHVRAAVVRLNEAKALLGVEPLNGSGLHSV